jgi:gluconate 2-dehydrogenase alpha chain
LNASRIGQSHDSIAQYQSTHNCGGAVMGADRSTSAVNRYLQSWDVPNLFVVGASAFAHNSTRPRRRRHRQDLGPG